MNFNSFQLHSCINIWYTCRCATTSATCNQQRNWNWRFRYRSGGTIWSWKRNKYFWRYREQSEVISELNFISLTENVGAIGVTKVGSRRVIQWAAIIMILQGVLNKFGTVFILIPDPIVGGIFNVMFGMICAFGMKICFNYLVYMFALLF